MKKIDLDLSGQVAVVTGSTKGLGFGMANLLAAHGAAVVINSRTEKDCRSVAEGLASAGFKSFACSGDVSDKVQVENLINKTIEEFGRIDILVNNAGIGITKSSIDLEEEEWDQVVDIDLKGVFLVAQQAAKIMINQNSGCIVNIASLGGKISSSRIVPYTAAKAGVIHMTKGLAVEWARYNIRVNAVAPGYVRTPLTEEILNDEKIYKVLTGLTPMRRLGTVEEIANVVLFLSSEISSYITGETIIVDGGRHAL